MKHTFLQKIQIFFIELLAKVHWKQQDCLSPEHMQKLRELLSKDYYIILNRKDNQLSTYLIGLGHWFLTFRWGYYSHALMNLEDEVKTDADFRLIEATSNGVEYNDFQHVFGPAYAVALLKPRGITIEEWTACLDDAKKWLGTPYDNLFDLRNEMEINCVELVRRALMALPNYETRFVNFEKLIQKNKKLTPQMFAECPDFEIVFKAKR